jgi:hypothetical protein
MPRVMGRMLAEKHQENDSIPTVPKKKKSIVSFAFRKTMGVECLDSAGKIAGRRVAGSPNRTNMQMVLLIEMFTAWSQHSREKREEDRIVSKIQDRLLGTFYKNLGESTEIAVVEDVEIFRTIFEAWKIYHECAQREKQQKVGVSCAL